MAGTGETSQNETTLGEEMRYPLFVTKSSNELSSAVADIAPKFVLNAR